jgi:hypothetical protein
MQVIIKLAYGERLLLLALATFQNDHRKTGERCCQFAQICVIVVRTPHGKEMQCTIDTFNTPQLAEHGMFAGARQVRNCSTTSATERSMATEQLVTLRASTKSWE